MKLGMMDRADPWMRCEAAREIERRGFMRQDPDGQGAHAPKQQPRFERSELRADIGANGAPDMADQIFAACQYTRDGIAVAADVLLGGVQHQIHAQRDRPLKYRGGPRIVDHAEHAVPSGESRQRAHIERLHHPTRRTLEV
jgi:hypothetical protein